MAVELREGGVGRFAGGGQEVGLVQWALKVKVNWYEGAPSRMARKHFLASFLYL